MDSIEKMRVILAAFTPRVYFNPHSNQSLQYPCIVYTIKDIPVKSADNAVYGMSTKFNFTFITKNPVDPIIFQLANRREFRFNNSFKTEGLIHSVFTTSI